MQSYKEHFKVNFNLAFPVMLSQLGHVLVGTADSMMVGQTGATPLAGASLGNVVFYVLMTFGIGISYGSTPLIAAADGKGDKGRIGSLIKNSFWINIITGIALFIIVLVSSKLMYYMKQPQEVVVLAIPYLKIITFSLIPIMIFQTFRQFMEGLSITRSPMYISIFSNLVNVFLNWVLIFGKLGFEPMGLNGAGIASLISRIIMAVWIVLYFLLSSRFKIYREQVKKSVIERIRIKRILKIGFPAALQYIIEVGAFGSAVIMMGWISTQMIAAHQIAINIAAITYMMASGLAAAATIRAGNQLGKKDIPNLKRAVNSLLIMVVIFMSVNAILFVLFRNFLPTLYVDEVEVIQQASILLILAAFFQLSDGVQVVIIGALRGLEDTLIPTVYIFVAYGFVGLPLGYILGFIFDLGGIGIWIGLSAGLTTVAFTLLYRFHNLSGKLMLQHK